MSDPLWENGGVMIKQLELWKDFQIVARFGRAWIVEVNGELHLSGGSKEERAEALEYASMFLADRVVRVKMPAIQLRPIDEVRLAIQSYRCPEKMASISPLVGRRSTASGSQVKRRTDLEPPLTAV